MLTELIVCYAGHLGEFTVMPGENELEALAAGATRIINGEEEGREY